MAEKYNTQAIMSVLIANKEMDPDKHDGCYELMRETIKVYSKLNDFSILDYKDLNLVYLTTVGTWKQGIEAKKKTVNESHLFPDDKEYLTILWDEIWERAGRGEYTNYEMSAAGNRSIGMFGTGFLSFQNKTTSGHAQEFIKMCVDILPLVDDDKMFDRAAQVLTSSFQGMRAASASMVLHCLKPFTFPVLNSNMGNRNIFEVLGVNIIKSGNIETYIDNCRKIKAFRDENFSYKNYRIFDTAAWKVNEYIVNHPTGKFDSWEVVSEDIAQTTCDKSFFEYRGADIPQGIRWFFNAEGLQSGRKQEIVLVYDSFEYDAYIQRESISPARTRLFWNSAFAKEFSPFVNDGLQHILEFQRIEENRYEVKFVIHNSSEIDDWWPSLSEYDPGLTADQYYDLFTDKDVTKKDWLEALYDLYKMPGHLGTCAELQDRYGKPYARYNRFLTSIGRRILEKMQLDPPKDNESSTYWPILFQGKYVKKSASQRGGYSWRMRVPVIQAMEVLIEEKFFEEKENEAMDQLDNIQYDHNMILYGPPGTGKTYNSVNYAVAICENRAIGDVMKEPYPEVLRRYREFQEAGQIAFTTFHQSYGYEEFIEGIKPKLNEESETLGYTIEAGAFKDFCRHASTLDIQAKGIPKIKNHPRIWGMILGGPGMTTLKKECFNNNEIRIGWHEVEDGQWNDDENLSWRAKQMLHAFIYEMEPGDVIFSQKDSQSVDAFGIITGDYEYDSSLGEYPRRRTVEWIAKNIDEDVVKYLPRGRQQLARFTVYSLDSVGTNIVSVFISKYMGNQESIEESKEKPHVFIIDEINRGNISKIFGELITLIEDTKRAGASEAMEAILPYSGEPFSVPKNVYILGTMNTADRSIALMDTALRRRFEFIEMMPNSEVLDSLGVGTIAVEDEELNIARMLDIINERIEYLFDREHTIGHAFFTKLADDPSLEVLASIFEKNVIPLLQEYFYEDYEKIQLVLGDNAKEDEFKFVLDKPLKIKDIFNGNPDIDLPEKGYSIQKEAFLKLNSYKQIGKDL